MERIDEIWLKLGYNLSDANASWLKEDSNPEILEIQAEAEDFRRTCLVFGLKRAGVRL